MFARLLATLGLAVAVFMASGCGTAPGGGGGSSEKALATTRIDYAARFNVEKATIGVFTRAGYVFTDRTDDELTFQSRDGRVRFDVFVTTPEYRLHNIFCDAYEARDGAEGAGTQWVRAENRTSECRQLLREIKKMARLL